MNSELKAKFSDLVTKVDVKRGRQESIGWPASPEELTAQEKALKEITGMADELKQSIKLKLGAVEEERTICNALGCSPGQIARSQDEISAGTTVYVGPLGPDVFERLYQHNVRHIYNGSYASENQRRIGSFLKRGVRSEQLEETAFAVVDVSSLARTVLYNEEEFVEPVNSRYDDCECAKETYDFACLTLRDLGFTEDPTLRQLFEEQQLSHHAAELGFEPCLPEDVAALATTEGHDTLGEFYTMAMQPIPDSDCNPRVFYCERDEEDGLWLSLDWAAPDDRWNLDDKLVLRRLPPDRSRAGKSDA